MRKELKLRQDNIPEISVVDQATVELSDKFLTLSTYRKAGEGSEERFDMVLLNIKEATALLNFLKENV